MTSGRDVSDERTMRLKRTALQQLPGVGATTGLAAMFFTLKPLYGVETAAVASALGLGTVILMAAGHTAALYFGGYDDL